MEESKTVADLEARLQSAEQENATLRTRITLLEQENAVMRAKLLKSNNDNGDDDSGKKKEDVFSSIAPSILSLLVKTDYIGVRDLGGLACASATLHRYICVEYDEDTWAYLLSKNWPSVAMMLRTILEGQSYREWYKRIELAQLFKYGYGDEYDIQFSKRAEIRSQLRSIGYRRKFPPLPPSSLRLNDMMFLIDVKDTPSGKCLYSLACRGDEADLSLIDEGQRWTFSTTPSSVVMRQYYDLIELGDGGTFIIPDDELICFVTIRIVRLTDFKVIGGETFTDGEGIFVDRCDVYFDPINIDIEVTTATARLEDVNAAIPFFRLNMRAFHIQFPICPRRHGEQYTRSKFEEYSRSHQMVDSDYSRYMYYEFERNLWSDASSKSEFRSFFNVVEEERMPNGKYCGEVMFDGPVFDIEAVNCSFGDFSFSHVIEALFEDPK